MKRKKETPPPIQITPEELAWLQARRVPKPKSARVFAIHTAIATVCVLAALSLVAYRLGYEAGIVSGMEEFVSLGQGHAAERTP